MHAQKALLASIIGMATTLIGLDQAHAWGRRGHAIVCETAAYLAAEKSPKAAFLKKHSFDLGYYCNVPDFTWKKGDLYQKEWFNHFMDMEIFERAFKEPSETKIEKPFALDRLEFEKTFPKVGIEAGRAFWRIRELFSELEKHETALAKTDVTALKAEERLKIQAEWLVTAGAIGHYVGDLAQPLHVSENYDGQLSEQKGIHAWFEDDVVDELFIGSVAKGLESDVMTSAARKWRKNGERWMKLPVLTVIEELAQESNKALKELLKIDRKIGRKDLKKAARAYRPMIVEQMALGSIALSTLWQKHVAFDYEGKKFYNFVGEPAWLPYPKAPEAKPTPQQSK